MLEHVLLILGNCIAGHQKDHGSLGNGTTSAIAFTLCPCISVSPIRCYKIPKSLIRLPVFVCLFVFCNKSRKSYLGSKKTFGLFFLLCRHTASPTVTSGMHTAWQVVCCLFVCWGFFFGCCFVATQLARQLHQERLQVGCSNKEARKRLARRHSRNGPWTQRQTHIHVVKIKEKYSKTHIQPEKQRTCMKNTHM